MNATRTTVYGILFGFLLSRSGATSFDVIHRMFSFAEFHLYGVIGLAIGVAALGFFAMKRYGLRSHDGDRLALERKPLTPGLVVGSLLFGAGWAISGTCPGTALAQLGEGSLAAGLTIFGILLGAYVRSSQCERSRTASMDAGGLS